VHHGSASGQSVPSVSSDGSCTSTPPRSAEPSPLRPSNSLFLTLVGFRHLPAAASVRCPHHHRPRWSPPFPHPHQRFCTSAHHPRMAPTPVCCPASHRGLGQAPHACVGQPLFPLISFAQAPESHHPRCQSRRKPSAPLRSGTTTSFQTPRPRNVVASHAGMGGVSAVSRPAVVLLLWVESCTSLLSRLARSSPKSCLRRLLHFTSLLALAGGRGPEPRAALHQRPCNLSASAVVPAPAGGLATNPSVRVLVEPGNSSARRGFSFRSVNCTYSYP
jgi:hypothetical protein